MDTQGENYDVYIEPVAGVVASMQELMCLPGERALLEMCIQYFMYTLAHDQLELDKLRRLYRRKGTQMFVWKYYRAARHYVGGVKALSAHLYLRSI